MEDNLQKNCKWKTTSKKNCKWKATSNKFVNGRRPQKKLYLEENLMFFCKWKMTYIGLEITQKKLYLADHNNFCKERQLHFFLNGRQPLKNLKMEDKLNLT